jgi:5-methylcytosine-specific restriction endonuclease McrA
LVDRTSEESAFQPIRIKLDPGSKTTGIAVVREDGDLKKTIVLSLLELNHRGMDITLRLISRSMFRRRRRNVNLRHRGYRYFNRRREKGWLAPSLQHRIRTLMTWINRLSLWVPVTNISIEMIKFDTQKLQNPNIQVHEYQKGTLYGCEIREYLLEKWNRKCAYCGAYNVPLNIEHIYPVARCGSSRLSNLVLSCEKCNDDKRAMPIEVFLKHKPELLQKILNQTKRPLRDAGAMNSIRYALVRELQKKNVPLEECSGSVTSWNRYRLNIPKGHALDAACVGETNGISRWNVPILQINATGRGRYQRTLVTKEGFPRFYCMRQKRVRGFQTGDMVRAVVPIGKNVGTYVGRVAVRARGIFNIQTKDELIRDINCKYCTLLSRADGYGYAHKTR